MSNTITVRAEMPKEIIDAMIDIPAQLNALKREIESLKEQKITEFELPVPGESSFDDIKNRLGGMHRTTWDRLVSDGKAPPRIKRGRATKYDNTELIRYFNEKENYKAPSK
jgi:adenylate kinase family enzyme